MFLNKMVSWKHEHRECWSSGLLNLRAFCFYFLFSVLSILILRWNYTRRKGLFQVLNEFELIQNRRFLNTWWIANQFTQYHTKQASNWFPHLPNTVLWVELKSEVPGSLLLLPTKIPLFPITPTSQIKQYNHLDSKIFLQPHSTKSASKLGLIQALDQQPLNDYCSKFLTQSDITECVKRYFSCRTNLLRILSSRKPG